MNKSELNLWQSDMWLWDMRGWFLAGNTRGHKRMALVQKSHHNIFISHKNLYVYYCAWHRHGLYNLYIFHGFFAVVAKGGGCTVSEEGFQSRSNRIKVKTFRVFATRWGAKKPTEGKRRSVKQTHPGCVVDPEDSTDDILLQVSRDEFHLQRAQTMEAILRPVLRAQLTHTHTLSQQFYILISNTPIPYLWHHQQPLVLMYLCTCAGSTSFSMTMDVQW